ncbi:hypothetical protein DM01DRAFT_1339422 [Hesseltinella vesiculosa]|uniref:PX domain-containing protein n=1 Tax=Hesseltinella vesiculosa TaxID=101127 RepID=A0A1X2G734_9FUNG|nr:hypothetical protein DM01DRAFT_1339422 [Hesseltinella vesiculosa]
MDNIMLDRRLTKTLLDLELEHEWSLLLEKSQTTTTDWIKLLLSSAPPTNNTENSDSEHDTPLLQFVMQDIIQPFPLIRCQSREQQLQVWQLCQALLTAWTQRLPRTWTPPSSSDAQERRVMMTRLKKGVTKLVTALIHGPTATLGKPAKIGGHALDDMQQDDPMTIDILTALRTGRNKATYFIIETTLLISSSSPPQTYRVARRHRDFVQLAKQLQPALDNATTHRPPAVPSKSYQRRNLRSSFASTFTSPSNKHATTKKKCWAEDDRRRLRCYLRQLIALPTLQDHPLLFQFLTHQRADDSHMDNFCLDEQDLRQRQTLDAKRKKEELDIYNYMEQQRLALDTHLDQLIQALTQPRGCHTLLDQIKATEHWKDLPPYLQKCFEWGKCCLAFTLHHQLVVSGWASENRRQFKKTHGLVPYRLAAAILRIGNPLVMMKALLSLFLARPFGQQSLMQRTILVNLQEEMASLCDLIQDLEQQLPRHYCDRLYRATYTERSDITFDSHDELELLHHVLQWDLSDEDDSDDNGQDHLDPKMIAQLQQLWHLYADQRELTACVDLLGEAKTGELLQALAAMMYEPLAHVYHAADMSTTLGHVQSFMNDIDQVIQSLDSPSPPDFPPASSIQAFLDVVDRHDLAFYQFVRKVHSQTDSTFFTDLIDYVDRWLSRLSLTTGIRAPLDASRSSTFQLTPRDRTLKCMAVPDCLTRREQKQLQADLALLKLYDQDRQQYKLAKKMYKMQLSKKASLSPAMQAQPIKPSHPPRSQTLPMLLPHFLRHIQPILYPQQ